MKTLVTFKDNRSPVPVEYDDCFPAVDLEGDEDYAPNLGIIAEDNSVVESIDLRDIKKVEWLP